MRLAASAVKTPITCLGSGGASLTITTILRSRLPGVTYPFHRVVPQQHALTSLPATFIASGRARHAPLSVCYFPCSRPHAPVPLMPLHGRWLREFLVDTDGR